MRAQRRENWSHDVDEVIRSRHYTWLAMGLSGEPIEDAMTRITTDIMHVCRRQGIPWKRVLERSAEQFEAEERQVIQRN